MSFKVRPIVVNVLAIFGLLLAFSEGALAQAATGWTKFEPPGKEYSVLMPVTPEKLDPQTPSMNDMQMYLSVKAGMSFLVIGAEVSDVDWKVQTSRDNFMAGFRRSSCIPNQTAGNNCEVVLLPELPHKGHLARDFKVLVNGEEVGIGRTIFVGTTAYTLLMSGYGVQKRTSDAKKFIDSFEPVVKSTPKLSA